MKPDNDIKGKSVPVDQVHVDIFHWIIENYDLLVALDL